jgi:hypothetical protein
MTVRLARTNAEAHIYLEMHPCETCGESEFDPGSSVILVDGDLVSRYAGACPRCGTLREFTFRIPQEIILPDDEDPVFGDERPSELIDAGEWLWIADLIAGGTPAEPDGMTAQERRQSRVDLRTAAAAVAEARKFVPPDADAVPSQALWSERGRAVYDDEPGRFRRGRLDVVERTFRELADRFAD